MVGAERASAIGHIPATQSQLTLDCALLVRRALSPRAMSDAKQPVLIDEGPPPKIPSFFDVLQ
jgi:hypothetical protein